MLVKILGQEYKVSKAVRLVGEICGTLDLSSCTIVVRADKEIRLSLYHEIMEAYMRQVGIDQIGQIDKESVCNVFGSCVNNLLIENGTDIFKRLEEWLR